jgi:N6-adenosine-specific RNA methylase IME4
LTAVTQELKEAENKHKRKDYEARAQRGARVANLVTLVEAGEKFAVIYADPAWKHDAAYNSERARLRGPERHYDGMSLDAIKALPVAQLAAKDCALFLWCVRAQMQEAREVIKAWGFEIKTSVFTWVKTTKHAEGITLSGEGLHWGMGSVTRSNTEVVLLGTRGNPQRMAKDVHEVVIAPVGEHSEKPEEVRRRIERLYLGPYLELFARRDDVEGWKQWGNEIAVMEAAE